MPWIMVLAVTIPWISGPSLGQVFPLERLPDLPELEEPPPGPEFDFPPVPVPPEDAPLSRVPVFELRGIEFVGNTVFTGEKLRDVASPFLNRSVSAEDLEQLRRSLTQVYIEAGFINSGAVLPDQEVIDGVVTFVIVEGALSQITISGNERMRADYLRNRLELSTGPPLNVNDLQERLRILLDDPFVRRLDARLRPGVRPGDAELEVIVEETSALRLFSEVSNRRNPAIGSNEIRLGIDIRNLTGWGDLGSLELSATEGLRNVIGEFSMPVTARDTRLGFRYEFSDSDVVEDPFEPLGIESDFTSYLLYVSHPVFRAPGQEYLVELQFEREKSRSFLLDMPFSFTEGPRDGESVVSAIRLTNQWIDRGPDHVVAARLAISRGLDILGATSNDHGVPDGKFTALLGQLQYVQRLPDSRIQIIARAQGQYSPDRLLPIEKFPIGGVDTVRGYRDNFLIADSGLALTLEGRIPIADLPLPELSAPSHRGTLSLTPFFDWGQVWNNDAADPTPDHLASVGVGLRWSPTEFLDVDVSWAHQLTDVPEPQEEALIDDGVSFRVRFEF